MKIYIVSTEQELSGGTIDWQFSMEDAQKIFDEEVKEAIKASASSDKINVYYTEKDFKLSGKEEKLLKEYSETSGNDNPKAERIMERITTWIDNNIEEIQGTASQQFIAFNPFDEMEQAPTSSV